MNKTQIYEAITPIFRSALKNDTLIVDESLTSQDVAGWDSLTHLRIIINIEKLLKIRFSPAEVSELPNVGAIVTLIEQKTS